MPLLVLFLLSFPQRICFQSEATQQPDTPGPHYQTRDPQPNYRVTSTW